MIPVKVTVTGDIPKGRMLVGFAKDQMRILERAMSFQSLNEGERVVSPFPGMTVTCWSSFSLQEIRIHVTQPAEEKGVQTKKKTEERKECYCFPHISLAKVLAVYPSVLPEPQLSDYVTTAEYNEAVVNYETSIEEYNAFLLSNKSFTYDLEVCTKYSYILFYGAHDANYGKYYVDQMVLVSVGYVIEGAEYRWETFPAYYSYPCDRDCLMADPWFPNLIIIPVHIVDEQDNPLMGKWYIEETIESDNTQTDIP